MDPKKNVSLIKKLFASLTKGDVQTFLDHLDEKIEWEFAGPAEISFYGKRRGREEVARMFKECGETFECEPSQPSEFISQGNKVVIMGHDKFKVKATGRSYETSWAWYITLRRGQIVKIVSYEDTASFVKALKAA